MCRILIQNEQLEQVDTFPYLGSLITEDGECTTEFRTRLKIVASLQKIWKSDSIPISTKILLTTALVWPVAMYGCLVYSYQNGPIFRLEVIEGDQTWL